MEPIHTHLAATRDASRQLTVASEEVLQQVILRMADILDESHEAVLAANAQDLARMDPEDPKYDRLRLDPERLAGIAGDARAVARLPCPVGEVLEQRTLDNGLGLQKVRVPVGVVAVVYESRPNVTFDVVSLCLRTANAAVLTGSRVAADSNAPLVAIRPPALAEAGLPREAVYLAPAAREALKPILDATEFVDLAIPRGSQGLIDFVRDNARVPVIETGAGIVHTYVDAAADLAMAKAIITNAKSRRVSVCNALDTVVLHSDHLGALPMLLAELGELHGVEVFADERAGAVLAGAYAGPLHPAAEEDFGREFLALKMSVKVVDGLDEALTHIARYSSKHSEAVVTEDETVAERFLREVDAAAVYHNTSTAYTDGAQFGMGAEIGISTQKLHARGPMALPELTSYKWIVRGTGQIRSA
ncbi:MAG: glutamate-5-semialdehyde dehydrogenase [Pseudomonadota bacterium]